MSEYSDQLVKDAVANGGCELIKQIATPFVTLVIADLLGVPADDRQLFMDAIEAGPPPGSLNSDDLMAQNQPLVIMGMYFAGYVQDRRQRSTRRYPVGVGQRDLSRRLDTGRPGNRSARDLSIRRRTGHQRQAPGKHDEVHR